MSRQPEPRTGRDGVPIGGTPLTRENTRQAFEPLADSVQRLGDSIDALHDRVRDQKHILDDAELPENSIDDAIAEAFGKPVPPPDPFGEPQEVDEVDSVPVRVTMAMRLDALRKDREAAREF